MEADNARTDRDLDPGRIRILFVDDDPLLGAYAEAQLGSETTDVVAVLDGAVALQRLAQEPFDVILTDIDMPKLDGFALVRAIREDPALAHLPVIMVTGADDTASIDRSFEVGASGFVSKPVHWHQLKHQIRYVLRASRLETELRQARTQADEASRLKGNIMRAMRHEFRTPLNAILGFAQLLQSPAFQEQMADRTSAYARDIEHAGRRLLALLNDMVSASELVAGEAQLAEDDYDLSRLVARALDQVTELTGEAPDIQVVGLDDAVRVSCDRDLFCGMLRHLIVNALTHGSGGRCELRAAVDADGSLSVNILDEGPGLPPAVLHDDVGFFLTAGNLHSRFQAGIGLGLASAMAVAKMHGCAIRLANREGGGAHVGLTIPRHRVDRSAAAVA